MSDYISRKMVLALPRNKVRSLSTYEVIEETINVTDIEQLPSAQPDIKQAAKLLSDFIESCPGGDSYLITPDGKELRTDWGYALNGVQLIYEWAERRNDE